nr:10652_t:CDS:2 [Entrophospora candida]
MAQKSNILRIFEIHDIICHATRCKNNYNFFVIDYRIIRLEKISYLHVMLIFGIFIAVFMHTHHQLRLYLHCRQLSKNPNDILIFEKSGLLDYFDLGAPVDTTKTERSNTYINPTPAASAVVVREMVSTSSSKSYNCHNYRDHSFIKKTRKGKEKFTEEGDTEKPNSKEDNEKVAVIRIKHQLENL